MLIPISLSEKKSLRHTKWNQKQKRKSPSSLRFFFFASFQTRFSICSLILYALCKYFKPQISKNDFFFLFFFYKIFWLCMCLVWLWILLYALRIFMWIPLLLVVAIHFSLCSVCTLFLIIIVAFFYFWWQQNCNFNVRRSSRSLKGFFLFGMYSCVYNCVLIALSLFMIFLLRFLSLSSVIWIQKIRRLCWKVATIPLTSNK